LKGFLYQYRIFYAIHNCSNYETILPDYAKAIASPKVPPPPAAYAVASPEMRPPCYGAVGSEISHPVSAMAASAKAADPVYAAAAGPEGPPPVYELEKKELSFFKQIECCYYYMDDSAPDNRIRLLASIQIIGRARLGEEPFTLYMDDLKMFCTYPTKQTIRMRLDSNTMVQIR
jgi:hypothetical protein